jgi:hypothetical protein
MHCSAAKTPLTHKTCLSRQLCVLRRQTVPVGLATACGRTLLRSPSTALLLMPRAASSCSTFSRGSFSSLSTITHTCRASQQCVHTQCLDPGAQLPDAVAGSAAYSVELSCLTVLCVKLDFAMYACVA